MGNPLVVDFHGPIGFRFCTDKVIAYLPHCKGHDCNILTDVRDIGVHQKKHYVLNGPTSNNPPLQKIEGVNVITAIWGKDTNGKEPHLGRCYCTFELPIPEQIFGLRAESTEITDQGGTVRFPWGNYARGLRFYYSDSDNPTITPPPSKKEPLEAKYFSPDGSTQYRIEVRLHDLNQGQDYDHADAIMCSRTMRKLFPPLDNWVVNFDKNTQVTIRPAIEYEEEMIAIPRGTKTDTDNPWAVASVVEQHAVDCSANPFVLDDGGFAPGVTH
ncbi:MAG TPA: hypothetical protein VN946_10440 [Terriglobales bacterium]|jgi:hypothetical protein|nr:hypothetical protein [Terriglobales bacterium]